MHGIYFLPDSDTSMLRRLGTKVRVVAAVSACTLMFACATPPPDLVSASRLNDVPGATALLDSGADPNFVGRAGEPALNVALERRSERIAQLLLARGADPNRTDGAGRPALAFLSHQTALAQSVVDTGLIATFIYAANLRYVCARELTAETAGQVISQATSVNLLFPARSDEPLTALIQASSCGHLNTMRQLLAAGATVDGSTPAGDTALSYAAGGGYPEAVGLLLESGANPNARGQAGGTPLMAAVRGGSLDHIAVARLLLDHQAVVDERDSEGNTALIMAAQNENQPGMVELLITAGANPRLENLRGETALSVARGEVRAALERSVEAKE